MHIEFKRGSIEDIEFIKSIGKETFYETFKNDNTEQNMQDYLATAFTTEKIMSELKNPYSQFYLLFADAELAGYLKVNTESAQTENMGADALEIERIYIKQTFHKMGLGKTLMNKAIDIAAELNKNYIWLGVWEKNRNAIDFYIKAGFEECGKHSFYMGDEEQVDWIMKKRL